MTQAAPLDVAALDDATREVLRRLEALEGRVAKAEAADRLALVVFSGSYDRMLAAFVLATTAAASGMEVEMFFTFWGLAALRDVRKSTQKDLIGRLFGWMLPRGMGDMWLQQYLHVAQTGPPPAQPFVDEPVYASGPWRKTLPLPPGLYYLVLDNTPTAGRTAPTTFARDDRAAVVSYAIELD